MSRQVALISEGRLATVENAIEYERLCSLLCAGPRRLQGMVKRDDTASTQAASPVVRLLAHVRDGHDKDSRFVGSVDDTEREAFHEPRRVLLERGAPRSEQATALRTACATACSNLVPSSGRIAE